MAAIKLAGIAETERLGKITAEALLANRFTPLLLRGPLGCGKTALTAAICAAFPDSEKAEVSSPSFTICNLYPCRPPILHCDLYRCKRDLPEEALDFMDAGEGQIILEWAEYLEPRPAEYLDFSFELRDNIRLIEINASGEKASAAAAFILARLNS